VRNVRLDVRPEGETALVEGESPRVALLATALTEDGAWTVVGATADGRLHVVRREERTTPLGEKRVEQNRTELTPRFAEDEVTALAVRSDGRRLYVGTRSGMLHRFELGDEPRHAESVRVAPVGEAVTALSFLLGDRTLVVGDATGAVSAWLLVRDEESAEGWRSERAHVFEPHPAAVTTIAVSARGKSFLTGDARGGVRLRHSTSEQTLLRFEGTGEPIVALHFAARGDGAVAVSRDGAVKSWSISSPHPEVTLRTLFGKVWYEGYDGPEYVWQSTGGTDDFEPKLSLVPLVFGTLKGTAYALLFAVPVAILAALYTSQFARPEVRRIVKPTIEIMAALPSVVLGFLAGLWLAPLVARVVPGILAAFVVVPLSVMAAAAAWSALPGSLRALSPPGNEILLLLPIVALGAWASVHFGAWLEAVLFGGDFPRWLYESAGRRYDQRNSLVVGFAMGFAVIPIIFTISEDALSNVPARLVSASLALGASPWQTAVRVVLPTASPGIFSATMIGFGRAVGETMIVLMATGNTPVMDWSLFDGFRALSANIAVEIPEAPYGGTLYRVLFLAALLLFVATFAVNTAAEIVRQRLRARYARL
jgi:phosphate transport system permease protein